MLEWITGLQMRVSIRSMRWGKSIRRVAVAGMVVRISKGSVVLLLLLLLLQRQSSIVLMGYRWSVEVGISRGIILCLSFHSTATGILLVGILIVALCPALVATVAGLQAGRPGSEGGGGGESGSGGATRERGRAFAT